MILDTEPLPPLKRTLSISSKEPPPAWTAESLVPYHATQSSFSPAYWTWFPDKKATNGFINRSLILQLQKACNPDHNRIIHTDSYATYNPIVFSIISNQLPTHVSLFYESREPQFDSNMIFHVNQVALLLCPCTATSTVVYGLIIAKFCAGTLFPLYTTQLSSSHHTVAVCHMSLHKFPATPQNFSSSCTVYFLPCSYSYQDK